MAGAPGGPLTAVLSAVQAGAGTVAEVRDRTGLSDDVARTAMEHLRRAGRLRVTDLSAGCPLSGCGGCSTSCP